MARDGAPAAMLERAWRFTVDRSLSLTRKIRITSGSPGIRNDFGFPDAGSDSLSWAKAFVAN
jgi:hypothetical protein